MLYSNAGDLRRWQVHTLTDHVVFPFQAKVFIAGNKQGEVRGFEIQRKVNWIKKTTSAFLSWAVSGLKWCPRRWPLAVSWVEVISPWGTMAQISS